jgi:AraC-like DNA-binding protein
MSETQAGDTAEGYIQATPTQDGLTPDSPVIAEAFTQGSEAQPSALVHAAFEVGILLHGTQERHCEGVLFPAGPGDAWLCGMWEPHGWCNVSPETTCVVLRFLPEFLGDEFIDGAPWLSMFGATPALRPRVRSAEIRERVLSVGKELAEEILERRSGWTTVVRSDLLRLLALLHREWAVPTASSYGMEHHTMLDRVAPALSLLRERPLRRVGVQQAATACNLSYSQFGRIFRRAMGMSFGAFCTRARLAHVAQQIVTTRMPLDGLAREAGFVDASHLHRAFVRRYGCTPGEYRQLAHLPAPPQAAPR